MGFNNSCIAVKSHDENQILQKLKLEKKRTRKKPEEFYARRFEDEIVGGVFNSDWYMIMDATWTIIENSKLVERCSKKFETLVCGIGEGWMGSSLSFWKDGKNIWRVEYLLDKDPNGLDEKGRFPTIYKELKTRNLAEENYFGVATDLFSELAGFDYGNYYPNDSGNFKFLKTLN